MSFFFWHVLYSFKNMSELSDARADRELRSRSGADPHVLWWMCAEGEWSPAKALLRCVRPARSFVACHSFSSHALFSHLVDLLCAPRVILLARFHGWLGWSTALCLWLIRTSDSRRRSLQKKKRERENNRKIIKGCLEVEHKAITCFVSRAWAWTHLPGPWPVIAKTILIQCIVLLSKANYS